MKNKPLLICEYLGGSHSYGLETPTSDADYRGIYLNTELDQIINQRYQNSSVATIDSKSSDEISDTDCVYYELRHFFHLLRKGNTQSIELLFNTVWLDKNSLFQDIQDARHSLVDPVKLNDAVKGYAYSEYKLAIGERPGKIGAKRQSMVEQYGFSPKNFVNLFRLLHCTAKFYMTGHFPVRIDEPFVMAQLKEIKNHPDRFTIQSLNDIHEFYKNYHQASWLNNSTEICEDYKYDSEVASKLTLACYIGQLDHHRATNLSLMGRIKQVFKP
jgi:predicted nucleotidyltransferase